MKFKAAILVEQNKPLVVDELKLPDLDIGQVLVRVHASGICGAQIGEISGAKGPDKYLPHLLGHEGGGIVEAIGPGVSTVKIGDHVVMHWRKGAGIEARPPRYDSLGWIEDKSARQGKNECYFASVGAGPIHTFNEMAVVSENRLTAIPKDVPLEVAALMGCAVTTALGLVNNEAKIKIGESVVVAGCGGVGLNIIQGAILCGANPVIGYDRDKGKFSLAQTLGAGLMTDNPEVLRQLAPFDVFVDCTGSCGVIALGYDLIRPGGGRMVLVGQPGHDQCLSLPGIQRHYCGKTVMDSQGGMTNPTEDIPRYVGLYKAGRLPLDRVITRRFALDEINNAVAAVIGGGEGRCILSMP